VTGKKSILTRYQYAQFYFSKFYIPSTKYKRNFPTRSSLTRPRQFQHLNSEKNIIGQGVEELVTPEVTKEVTSIGKSYPPQGANEASPDRHARRIPPLTQCARHKEEHNLVRQVVPLRIKKTYSGAESVDQAPLLPTTIEEPGSPTLKRTTRWLSNGRRVPTTNRESNRTVMNDDDDLKWETGGSTTNIYE
jgi:hypothetical protein